MLILNKIKNLNTVTSARSSQLNPFLFQKEKEGGLTFFRVEVIWNI